MNDHHQRIYGYLDRIACALESIARQADSDDSVQVVNTEGEVLAYPLYSQMVDPWYYGTPYLEQDMAREELARYTNMYMRNQHLSPCICGDSENKYNTDKQYPCGIEIVRRLTLLKKMQ